MKLKWTNFDNLFVGILVVILFEVVMHNLGMTKLEKTAIGLIIIVTFLLRNINSK